MDFENKIYEGIHYSRFVASFWRKGGKIRDFKRWLSSLKINGKHIPEKDIKAIYNYATNGKLELESHAKLWIEADKNGLIE